MNNGTQTWDTLITNALVFDGSGEPPHIGDVAMQDGKIVARGRNLPEAKANQVIDASGLWLMPGLLDIHTHLDLEVELNPGLGEAVRHGTTTVLAGNCSLGMAFGAQQKNGDEPIVDCFTRVENMPKKVLRKCVEKITWDNTGDYLAHFSDMPLGPNIAPLVPHSMLRIEVMGVAESISRAPNERERAQMRELLENAIEQGYIGLSTDQIVFHYLANDPHKNRRIPTQFAEDDELREMIELLRTKDRVWQTNPDSQKMPRTIKRFFWSCGRFRSAPLKVSALTAIDFVSTPGAWKALLNITGLINSSLLKGRMHMQALGGNFRVWSNGIVAPMFEELDSTRQLIACEADDRQARQALMDDPEWQKVFREDWQRVSTAYPLWRSLTGRNTQATFQIDLEKMFFDRCAIEGWNGESMASVMRRIEQWQKTNGAEGANDSEETQVFSEFAEAMENGPADDATEFFLHGLRRYDIDFRWWFDAANIDERIVETILFHPNALPGFNDSGAHITNMAFYDANLTTLRLAANSGGEEKVAQAVRRLTREPAEFFCLDVGGMEVNDQADLILIDPQKLKNYDSNQSRQMSYHEHYEHEIMVNRSDGVVREVYIHGTRVWEDGCRFAPALGAKTLGRALTYSKANRA